MASISFTTSLETINGWTIIHLPPAASEQLPSRGQVMVAGTINGLPITTPLEPDGNWGHWLQLPDKLMKQLAVSAGDRLELSVEPVREWPEPDIPADLQAAINHSPAATKLWQNITPMARWEWLRWTRSTGNQETRQRRISVAVSKLENGKRRPCCWNRNLCSEPGVSKSGVLISQTAASL